MSPNIITIRACINSNLAAAAGALTGVVLVSLFPAIAVVCQTYYPLPCYRTIGRAGSGAPYLSAQAQSQDL